DLGRQRAQPLLGSVGGAAIRAGEVRGAKGNEQLLRGTIVEPFQALQGQILLRRELRFRQAGAQEDVRIEAQRLVEVVGEERAAEAGRLQLRAAAALHA